MNFDRIPVKPFRRPDMCAFALLERLVPAESDGTDMVSAAKHDEIYLSIDCDALAKVATDDDIVYLVRCGVRYDNDFESLCMFV